MIKIKPGHCKICVLGRFWKRKKVVIANNDGIVEIYGLDKHEVFTDDFLDVISA